MYVNVVSGSVRPFLHRFRYYIVRRRGPSGTTSERSIRNSSIIRFARDVQFLPPAAAPHDDETNVRRSYKTGRHGHLSRVGFEYKNETEYLNDNGDDEENNRLLARRLVDRTVRDSRAVIPTTRL